MTKKLTAAQWAQIPHLREKGIHGRLTEAEQDLVFRAYSEDPDRYVEVCKGIKEKVHREIREGKRLP